MGGGGSKKKSSSNAAGGGNGGPAVYSRAPTVQTFQPTLPGFMGEIADQLSMGYGSGMGGTAPDQMAGFLSNLYKPMNVMRYQEPISTTAATWDKTKNVPINIGNSILEALLMGGGKVDTSKDKK